MPFHAREAEGRPACRLLKTLAWAVRHKVPLADALEALPECSGLRATVTGGNAFERRIRAAAEALRAGAPLWEALYPLRRLYPRYVLQALTEAEDGGYLPEMLPLVTDRMRRRIDSSVPWLAARWQLFLYLSVSSALITGLGVFIMPKLGMIYWEMAGSEPALMFRLSQRLAGVVTVFGWWLLLLIGPVAGTLQWFGWGRLGVRLPGRGGFGLRRGRLEAVQTMLTGLARGVDVAVAARWAHGMIDAGWVRRALADFVRRVEGGERWGPAWNATVGGDPVERWMVLNGAAREDPAMAFAWVEARLDEQIRAGQRGVVQWMPAAVSVVCGLVVGTLVMGLFGALVTITEAALNL